MIKTTAFMLAFITLVLLVFSSCTLWEKPEEHDLVAEWERNLANEDGVVDFVAQSYCLNSWYHTQIELPFRIDNGQIYSCYSGGDIFLYDNITYVEDVKFEYHRGVLERASFLDSKNESTIMETLEKLKQQKGCYVIETNDIEGEIERIIVYELDNAYYFLLWPKYNNADMVYSVSFAEFEENDNKCPFLSLFE